VRVTAGQNRRIRLGLLPGFAAWVCSLGPRNETPPSRLCRPGSAALRALLRQGARRFRLLELRVDPLHVGLSVGAHPRVIEPGQQLPAL